LQGLPVISIGSGKSGVAGLSPLESDQDFLLEVGLKIVKIDIRTLMEHSNILPEQ